MYDDGWTWMAAGSNSLFFLYSRFMGHIHFDGSWFRHCMFHMKTENRPRKRIEKQLGILYQYAERILVSVRNHHAEEGVDLMVDVNKQIIGRQQQQFEWKRFLLLVCAVSSARQLLIPIYVRSAGCNFFFFFLHPEKVAGKTKRPNERREKKKSFTETSSCGGDGWQIVIYVQTYALIGRKNREGYTATRNRLPLFELRIWIRL